MHNYEIEFFRPGMKPMVYGKKSAPQILLDGEFMGYRFLIVSYGTHPCAYVEIKEGHPLYGVGYEKASECVSVHGGFTYARNLAHVIGPNDGYFLGWTPSLGAEPPASPPGGCPGTTSASNSTPSGTACHWIGSAASTRTASWTSSTPNGDADDVFQTPPA